jgi:hypothetical protein
MQLPRRKVWDLSGEAQINDDGTPRQRVLAVLYPGEALTLQRQPDNPYDPNAIAVMAGRHVIGFIPRADAAQIAPLLDAGELYRAQLHELTGGMPDYPNFGAKVCIVWRDLKMLDPQPLKPEQTRHQSLMNTAPTSKGVRASLPIMAIAAIVVVCIIIAALL